MSNQTHLRDPKWDPEQTALDEHETETETESEGESGEENEKDPDAEQEDNI